MNLPSKSPHMIAFKASSTAVSLDQSGDSPPPSVKKLDRFRGFVASALETGSNEDSTVPFLLLVNDNKILVVASFVSCCYSNLPS